METRFLKRLTPLFLFLLLAPCLSAGQTVTDMAGRTVTLPDDIKRVFPVGHAAPIALAMAPEKVAVVSDNREGYIRFTPPVFRENKVGIGWAAPEEIKNKKRSWKKGLQPEDIERIKPDLILMEGDRKKAAWFDELQDRLKVPVFVVDQDMNRYEEAFTLLGRILKEDIQALKMTGFVVKYLHPIHQKTGEIPPEERVTYYYAHGEDGLETEPATNNHVQAMNYIHATNIYSEPQSLEQKKRTYGTTMEDVKRRNPDVIIVASMGADKRRTWDAVTTRPGWSEVTAVKKGNIYQTPWLPYSWLDRPPGSNRILGTVWLAKRLYPDRLARIDLNRAIRQYFDVFYHFSLSDDDIRELLKQEKQTP